MKVPQTLRFFCLATLSTLSFGLPAHAVPSEPNPSATQDSHPVQTERMEPTPADPLQRRIAEIKERTYKIYAGETNRAAESTSRQTQRKAELRNLQEQLEVALSMPPASPARSEQIDQIWFSLRNLVNRIQDDRFQALTALSTAQADREQIANDGIQDQLNNPSIDEAMRSFVSAHDARVTAVEQEIDASSTLIANAKMLRRKARQAASDEATLSVQGLQLEEIRTELTSIPIDLRSSVRQTTAAWWKNPGELSHVQALGALFLGLMELAFLLIFGMWAHGRIEKWTEKLLVAIVPDRDLQPWGSKNAFPSWVVGGDVRSLAPPLAALVQDFLVLAIAVTIMVWLGDTVPLIGWIALVFASGAFVRSAESLVSLALITPTESRPGLRVTSPEVRQASLWVIQYFGLLKAIEVVVVHLLVIILGADQIGEIFTEIIYLMTWGLAGVGLLRWGDLLRSRVQDGGAGSGIAKWIVHSGSSRLTGLLGAMVAVALLTVRFLSGCIQAIIDRRGGLAWLGTLLARRQLRDSGDIHSEPLSATARRDIGLNALQTLDLKTEVDLVQKRFELWQQDPRRGLLAITGDRGVGKSVLMRKLKAIIDTRCIEATTPMGHTKPMDALRWLAEIADVKPTDSGESLIQSLKKLPPTMFLLSNLNRLFLRAVGHYKGLDSVLEVMQATGRHHFWVVSFHEPAWSFLHGMSHVGHVNVFSQLVKLGQLHPEDLAQWIESKTRKTGIETDFESLLHRKQTGPDHARVLERTERAYWRLLADASQGNPSVAIRLWMDSLRPTSSAPEKVHVSLFKAHNIGELEELGDDELFALTALILHDDLTVAELHTVLNQSESNVRALCRGLEQRTVITETESGRYKVRLNWLPAVERHLRRRNFMHKS